MNLAPIVLFVYNRPRHTKQTIEALRKNSLSKDSELIIYSDGPKNENISESVQNVRNYLKTVDGFKNVTVVERADNLGLANSIISGVTEIVSKYEKIIVLEDDMITSNYFLEFMNKALNYYENEPEVISVHGYMYPLKLKLPDTFFLKGADCWGWATWKRGWECFEPDGKKLLKEILKKNLQKEFDFNYNYPYLKMLKDQIKGKNDSWAIRWYASAFLLSKLTLHPAVSLVKNIGNDLSGTHSVSSTFYDVNLSFEKTLNFPEKIQEYAEAKSAICNYLHNNFKYSILNRIKLFY